MVKRYSINSEFVFEDCLVTPSVYEGVLQRFDEFIIPFISHLHARYQQQKSRDYMKGLLSDTERKNIESISYFHGEDRQKLQKFIGQTEWDDELILDKLAKLTCPTANGQRYRQTPIVRDVLSVHRPNTPVGFLRHGGICI